MQLVLDVEDKIRVLKLVDLWAPTAPEAPAMALTAMTAVSDQLKEFLANHITAELTCLTNTHKNTTKDGKENKDGKDGKDSKSRSHFTHQDWMFIPPLKLSDTKVVNNRTYNWCIKCNCSNGQWVHAHTTDTHLDDFQYHKRQRQDSNKCQSILKNTNATQLLDADNGIKSSRVSFITPRDAGQGHHSAQLSLSHTIANGFRFDVQDLDDDE
jgi:hypothetical protein